MTTRPVVLLYHRVFPGVPRRLNRAGRILSPRRFEEQMAWLREAGYEAVTLEALYPFSAPSPQRGQAPLASLARRVPVPVAPRQALNSYEAYSAAKDGAEKGGCAAVAGGGKAAAIVFDDGYYDLLSYAIPILERHGFKATIHLAAGAFGREPAGQAGDPEAPGRILAESETRDLAKRGFAFAESAGPGPAAFPSPEGSPLASIPILAWETLRSFRRKAEAASAGNPVTPATPFARAFLWRLGILRT